MSADPQDSFFKNTAELQRFAESKNFIAPEMLAWLWYLCETDSHQVVRDHLGQERQGDIWVEDRVVLESAGGPCQTQTLKGTAPSQSPEAQISLLEGKSVKELKMAVRLPSVGTITFLWKANGQFPQSLKLHLEDALEGVEYGEELLDANLAHWDAFASFIDGLILKFIKLRSQPSAYRNELDLISKWIEARAKKAPDTLLH